MRMYFTVVYLTQLCDWMASNTDDLLNFLSFFFFFCNLVFSFRWDTIVVFQCTFASSPKHADRYGGPRRRPCNGHRALFSAGIRRPGREVNPLHLSVRVKNRRSYTYPPPRIRHTHHRSKFQAAKHRLRTQKYHK